MFLVFSVRRFRNLVHQEQILDSGCIPCVDQSLERARTAANDANALVICFLRLRRALLQTFARNYRVRWFFTAHYVINCNNQHVA